MKKILAGLFVAGALFSFSACSEFLDMTPTDRVSDKTIWETTEAAEYNVNYLYSYLIDIVNGQSGLGLTESLTDMLKYGSYNYNSHCYIPSEMAYGGTVITSGYVDVYMGFWGTMYTAIRKTNQAIFSLKNYGQMSNEDKLRLEFNLGVGFIYTLYRPYYPSSDFEDLIKEPGVKYRTTNFIGPTRASVSLVYPITVPCKKNPYVKMAERAARKEARQNKRKGGDE